MKKLTCEMCGMTDLVKQDGMYICQYCGTKYSVEEAKKMMVEGTVKIDQSEKIENSLINARRAYESEDWENAEKFYNIVEQESVDHFESIFFRLYCHAMKQLFETDFFSRDQTFHSFLKLISRLNKLYKNTEEDKRALKEADRALERMSKENFVRNSMYDPGQIGSTQWQKKLFQEINDSFSAELKNIYQQYPEPFIKEILTERESAKQEQQEKIIRKKEEIERETRRCKARERNGLLIGGGLGLILGIILVIILDSAWKASFPLSYDGMSVGVWLAILICNILVGLLIGGLIAGIEPKK